MWKDADPAEVKALWAEELSSFDGVDIRNALEALRFAHVDYPPTLYEFASLCRDSMRSRAQIAKPISVRYGQVAPEILASIHELAKAPGKRKVHPHDWARRLVKREIDGDEVNHYALKCAKEVVGVVDRQPGEDDE